MPRMTDILDELASIMSISEEDLTPEQRESRAAYAEELKQDAAAKIDAFGGYLREQVDRAKACKAEADRLTKKARNIEANIGWLQHVYLTAMQQADMPKIKGQVYTASIRHTPHVEVDDVGLLDTFYAREIPARREPDKKAIAEFLKGGGTLPGCRLVQSDSLQIR